MRIIYNNIDIDFQLDIKMGMKKIEVRPSLNETLPVSRIQEPLVHAPEMQEIPSKKIIRDLGLKVTQQRIQILESVRKGPSHFTAQDIYETVTVNYPEIGFATVYRFLKTLSSHSYVTEVRMGGMPARYEWASKSHHDHLTCTSCGCVVEFENDHIEKLQLEVAQRHGFSLTSHVLELFGICKDCKVKVKSK